jgi:hypothetical protein
MFENTRKHRAGRWAIAAGARQHRCVACRARVDAITLAILERSGGTEALWAVAGVILLVVVVVVMVALLVERARILSTAHTRLLAL